MPEFIARSTPAWRAFWMTTATQMTVLARSAGCLTAATRAYPVYNQYLADDWPSASGVIEGACRHLVEDAEKLFGVR